jgi:regulator of sigma E protease
VRAWIVAAGPLVNYAISILSLWTVLVIGYPELLPTVGRLIEDMPAKAAGVQVGDRILAVEGQPIQTWDELTRIIHRSANQPLSLAVQRNDATLTLRVTPSAREQMDPFGRARTVGLLGVSPSGAFTTYRVSPLEAVHQTASKQMEWLSQTGLSLWSMVTGRVPMQESMTGPIGIIYMTSEAVRMGLGALLYLVSIFSLSLAIFNFFPIPILDGGHLLFLACEKFRGRPVSLSVQERAAQISFALLMTMVVLVCFNDLNRLGVVEKVRGFWRG